MDIWCEEDKFDDEVNEQENDENHAGNASAIATPGKDREQVKADEFSAGEKGNEEQEKMETLTLMDNMKVRGEMAKKEKNSEKFRMKLDISTWSFKIIHLLKDIIATII